MREATYSIASKGLATSFNEVETPPEYALSFRNRYINAAGGAEMRQGMVQLGDTIPGVPNITGLHELIKSDGSTTLFASGQGKIYRQDGNSWAAVKTDLDTGAILKSVQFGEKLIFANGVDRNFYTEDGMAFTELQARIIAGSLTGVSGASDLTTTATDGNVGNWVAETDVAVNDILYNASRDAYAAITAVVSAAATADTAIQYTTMSSGATGLGFTSTNPQAGDEYEIIDMVELNIIPTDLDDDNVAVTTGDTSAAGIAVSGVTWTSTDVKPGDWIRNTTRSAVTQVTAVGSAMLGVHGISGQTAGDSLLLFKSAMPISKNLHTHFGRLYHIDARDQRKVRFSGPNDPQDMFNGGTIDASTFKFGELQPTGDIAVEMASYQRFFAIGGKKNLFFFSGTDPGENGDFAPIGLFPQGVVSQNGMVSIGNDIAFVTPDGVQTASLVGDASTLGRANISEAIKTTLRDLIDSTGAVRVFHYPRRSWFVCQVGSELYVFNYTAYFGQDGLSARAGGTLSATQGSWSVFDGPFARQSSYLVRNNGDLLCAGPGGKVYEFDADVYTDAGESYSTEYQTGWLTMSEPRKSVRRKAGKYIKPLIDVGTEIPYTIKAESGWGFQSEDEIVATAAGGGSIGTEEIPSEIGGSGIINEKLPLRWRGEVVRLTFTTPGGKGPDILSRYTIYHTIHGMR